MFARYQDILAGQVDEDGMGINNVGKALERVGINIRDAEGGFRDFSEVLDELYPKWGELTEVEQANITKALAGVRQRESLLILLENQTKYSKALEIQMESEGLAAERYATYLDSVEAAQNRLTASWEKLVMSAATGDMIADFYDGVGAVLELVNALGGIPTVLKIVIPALILFNAELIKTKVLAMGDMFSALSLGIKGLIPALMGTTTAAQGTTTALIATNAAAVPFVATLTLLGGALIYGTAKSVEFINAQEEIRKELETNYQDISKQTGSYDEYVKKMEEAAEAAGYFVESGKTYHEGYHGIKVYVNGMDLLSESMYNAMKLTDENERQIEEFNRDLIDSGEYAEHTASSYQTLAGKLSEISNSAESLSEIMERAEIGQLEFGDIEKLSEVYPEYLDALSVENGQLKLNTDLVREYLVEKANQAVAQAKAAGATETEIRVLQAYADQLQQQQYVMLNNVNITRGAFSELAWSIAQNAAMSGNSFVDMQGKALNSAESIYQYMMSGNQSFNDFVRQIANITGMTVEQVMNQINAMMVTVSQNAYALENSLRGMSGQAYGGGGNYDPLRYAIPNRREQSSVGFFAPAPIGYQYPGGLSDYQSSIGGSNSQLQEQNELEQQILETEKEIEEARKDAVGDLKDQLSVYKDIIDARKEMLDQMADEREYNQDVEDKNKEILKIQNELATLQFDTSEEAAARRLQLEDELYELSRELEDIHYDQSVEEQKNALDAEYKSMEDKINLAIRQIEGIQAGSLSEFASQLASILSNFSIEIPEYHSGGVVGKSASLQSNEVFAKLMSGEVVSTQSQIENFMSRTLPQIAQGSSNFNSGDIEISIPISVAGSLDKSVIPDINRMAERVLERVQEMMYQRGWNRRADLFQI